MGLERGPFSLVSTIKEQLGRESSGCGLEIPKSITLTTWHPLSANLALTSLISGDRSVGIVRSRTQATEFSSQSLIYEYI
jgi:hypothetical protein